MPLAVRTWPSFPMDLLVQQWLHDAAAFEAPAFEEQEKVSGRTKGTSIELAEEVHDGGRREASSDQEAFGSFPDKQLAWPLLPCGEP